MCAQHTSRGRGRRRMSTLSWKGRSNSGIIRSKITTFPGSHPDGCRKTLYSTYSQLRKDSSAQQSCRVCSTSLHSQLTCFVWIEHPRNPRPSPRATPVYESHDIAPPTTTNTSEPSFSPQQSHRTPSHPQNRIDMHQSCVV